jgi:peroxiredoxin
MSGIKNAISKLMGHQQRAVLEAGTKAPAFELKDIDGTSHSLESILEKGPALLALFKIGCPVCQMTFPFLDRLAHTSSVQIIGISQDEADATRLFNRRFGVNFPVLIDPARDGYLVSNAFGISSVPTMFLVEPDGTISKTIVGFVKKELLEIGNRIGVVPFRPDENVPEWKAG